MRPFKALLALGLVETVLLFVQCAGSGPGGAPSEEADAAADTAPAPLEDTGARAEAATNDGAADAGAASCALPPSGLAADESCAVCLQTDCCEAIVQCFEDPACVVIDSCLTACFAGVAQDGGLAGCESRCLPDASGATAIAAQAELACFTGACGMACPGAPSCGTPSGSYTQTCENCQVVGETLTCDCTDQAGDIVVSSLTLCGCVQPPVVANTDGVLDCPVPEAGEAD
jgi:hypothetical protein